MSSLLLSSGKPLPPLKDKWVCKKISGKHLSVFSPLKFTGALVDASCYLVAVWLLDLLPRVVLTPDSPPLDSMQLVRTLYSPDSPCSDNNIRLVRTLYSPESANLERLKLVRSFYSSDNPPLARSLYPTEPFGPLLYPLEERRESLEDEEGDGNRIPVTLALPSTSLKDSICIQVGVLSDIESFKYKRNS